MKNTDDRPTVARAAQLVAAGEVELAKQVLEAAAAGGDPAAAFALGEAFLAGGLFGRDLAKSRAWYAKAADLGSDPALDVTIAFLANGTGGQRDWQGALALLRKHSKRIPDFARQLELLAAMDIDDEGHPNNDPRAEPLPQLEGARHLPGFLTPAECDYLIGASGQHFRRSAVIDSRTGEFVLDPIRTSDVAPYPLALERPFIHAINLRIAKASGTTADRGEPLQVLRYSHGQEYKQHMDALPNADNQRTMTFLVYLNEDYVGGETVFPVAGLRFRGSTGAGLLFRNTTDDDEPDPRTTHVGMPVTNGIKFLASRWIRAKPLKLTL